MVINNWFIVVDMYTDIMSQDEGDAKGYVRFYFISFWIVIVLMQMNLLIAIVLEIYGSVAGQFEGRIKKIQNSIYLRKWLKDCKNDEEILERIRETRMILDEEEKRVQSRCDSKFSGTRSVETGSFFRQTRNSFTGLRLDF